MRQCPRCGLVYGSDQRTVCAVDGDALAALGEDVLLGRTLGTYKISGLIAAGRSSRVYRADDARGPAALKILLGERAGDPQIKKNYLVAASVSELRDPTLFVKVKSALTVEGVPIVAMELLEGRTLEKAQTDSVVFDSQQVIGHALSLVRGLFALHKKGRAHGAIGPREVWLDTQGRARWLENGLGEIGAVRGSIAAPERGDGPATAAGDVFAMGMMLLGWTMDLGPLMDVVSEMTVPEPKERPHTRDLVERLSAMVGVPVVDSMRPQSARPEPARSLPPKADVDVDIAEAPAVPSAPPLPVPAPPPLPPPLPPPPLPKVPAPLSPTPATTLPIVPPPASAPSTEIEARSGFGAGKVILIVGALLVGLLIILLSK